jgi:hypothetical protein
MLTELPVGALIIPTEIRDPPLALTDAVSAAIIEITKKNFFIFRLAEKFALSLSYTMVCHSLFAKEGPPLKGRAVVPVIGVRGLLLVNLIP